MARRPGSAWQIVMLAALAACAPACAPDRVEVSEQGSSAAYSQGEMIAAVERFAATDRSPARYGELAAKLAELEPRFDETVAREAERHLAFLALAPLESVRALSAEARFRALGTTVWPAVLGIPSAPGEDAFAYAERICRSELAPTCQRIVPEHRHLVLSELVWRRLRDRARDALGACASCSGDPGFATALQTYEQRYQEAAAQVTAAGEWLHPAAWPAAGEHALPWSGVPVVSVETKGKAMFEGREIANGAWRKELALGRKTSAMLGVSLRGTARVSELRAILRDAGAVGFEQVALQARTPAYPYSLVEYRMLTRPESGSPKVRVRDVDTVQILVEALDGLAQQDANSGSLPSI